MTLTQVLGKPPTSRFTAAIGTATIGFFAGIRCLAFLDGHDSHSRRIQTGELRLVWTRNTGRLSAPARGRKSQDAYRILERQPVQNGQQTLG